MQPVLPSTTVRGPAAFTISFMTRADSHPWHVRWPEVKYSSSGARLTPLIGSSTGTGIAASSGLSIGQPLLFNRTRSGAHADPDRVVGRYAGFGRLAGMVEHLADAGDRDLAAPEARDEAHDRRVLRLVVHRRANLVRDDAAVVRRAHREIAVGHAHRRE